MKTLEVMKEILKKHEDCINLLRVNNMDESNTYVMIMEEMKRIINIIGSLEYYEKRNC